MSLSIFLGFLFLLYFGCALVSDSRFHQVYSIALLLLSLLTAHLFNQPVSASSILCAILVLLLFILCIGLSPAQVLLFSTRSSPKKKALDYLSPEDGDHSIDIVAVHGLASNPETAWVSRNGPHSNDSTVPSDPATWLRDFLPKEKVLNARIMAFNHNTSWKAYALDKSLHDHGDDLLQALRTARQDKAKRRPIIFIGHSFGGLIIKQALVNAGADSADDFLCDVREKACGFIFLGTPHRGARLAVAGWIMSLFGYWRGSSTSLLEVIKPQSAMNESLHNDFMKYLQGDGPKTKNTVCVFEAVKELYWGMPIMNVVDKNSAIIDGSHKIGFETVHRNLQRFSNRDDENYQDILSWIRDWANKAKKEADAHNTAKVHEKTREELECIKSLHYPEMYQRQHDLEDAATDTCTWLLSHEKYTTWLAQPQALLWIAGKPGAGKSTLVGYALKQASHSSDVVASFFFFGRGIDLQKSSRGLYRSLLHQLLDHFPDMLSEFSSLYKKKCDTERKSGSNLEWHERELREFLEKWIPRASKDRPIRIYVDALDEAGREAAEELIKYFKRLTERLSPTGAELRICFSCRHYPILAPRDALQICVEDMNHQDIATHVRQSLENHFSDTDRTQLEQEIIGKASGVFLWVILVIPTVIKSRGDGDNLRKICEKINKISSKLEDLYEQILSKIEDQKRAAQLMQWVCFAMRPLSLGELRFAMVVDVTNHFASLKECENSVDFAETDEQMRRTVTSLSGGLAEIVEYQNRQTVRFIHQSVNDYLIDGGLHNLDTSFFQDINKYLRQSGLPSLENSWSDNVVGLAHFRLSRSCVKYMTLKEVMGYATAQVEISEASEIMEMEMIESEFPFLQYSQKWASHAKIVEKQRMPQKDLLILSRWPSEGISDSWWEQSDRKWAKYTLLRVASQYGLLSVIEAMIDSGKSFDFNAKLNGGKSALSLAAAYGHEAVVRLLIERDDVEIDSKDRQGQTPLLIAAAYGHEAVVRLLIERDDVEIDSKDILGRTPLSKAAKNGHEAVVRLLIERDGVEIDSKDKWEQIPLSKAAENGHEAVVRLLIERDGVEIDSKDIWEQIPLSKAAENGHEAVVRLLIERDGVEIDSKDEQGQTPLSKAAVYGHEAVVRLLIERDGVEIDSKDERGRTPLSIAAENGHEAVVRLLIERDGVEIDSKDVLGATPLLFAAYYEQEAVARLLIQRGGAQVDWRESLPLCEAIQDRHEAAIRLLSERGIETAWEEREIFTAYQLEDMKEDRQLRRGYESAGEEL